MRIMRLGPAGAERPAVAVGDDRYLDVSDVVPEIDGAWLERGGLDRLAPIVESRLAAGSDRPIGDLRIGAPIARPHQIVCIGLNYRAHAIETGAPIPAEPIVFTKAPNTLVGPNDDVRLPRDSDKTDWEVELGIVIGRRASYLADDAEAASAIAGYVLCNDVSERTFQLERGGQWTKGKSAETFNPCGPWLATPDELGDVLDLELRLDVNGERKQTASTSDLIFSPFEIVRYLSRFMVLEPGDLINTGTPHGVGMGLSPQQWLQAGDVIDLAITGLGAARQRVVAPRT